jgi:hypothetical protein
MAGSEWTAPADRYEHADAINASQTIHTKNILRSYPNLCFEVKRIDMLQWRSHGDKAAVQEIRDIQSNRPLPLAVNGPRPVPRDVIFFGVLMIVSGMMDLYIIVANPTYSLPFFGTKPTGFVGNMIKVIHPLIHFGSGYGAIYGKRWAYRLFMIYAVYGLINAAANFMLLPPPHRIRTIFMIGTALVMVYLYFRRNRFIH